MWVSCSTIANVSCCFTSNEPTVDFQAKLDHHEDKLGETEGPAIIGGDVNAKVVEWYIGLTDRRDSLISEMLARLDLNVANIGNTATFRNLNYEETIPDITLVSEAIRRDILNCMVTEDYTGRY